MNLVCQRSYIVLILEKENDGRFLDRLKIVGEQYGIKYGLWFLDFARKQINKEPLPKELLMMYYDYTFRNSG